MSRAEVFHPREISPVDVAAWRAMQANTAAFQSPLLGPDFARIVGEVRDDARIAVWRRDGAAIGFLPHHRRPTGFARPIGAPFADYHSLISTPDAALFGAEVLRSAKLTALRLSGLVDPFAVFSDVAAEPAAAYRIELDGPSAQYLDRLNAQSGNRGKNYRRYLRKIEAEFGETTLLAPDRRQASFDQLLAWKRLQLKRTGMHDFLRPAWTGALLQRLFETRSGDFEGLMITLYASGRLVAGHFGVRLGGHFHPWIGAMDPELEAYGPGFVHQWKAIEAMTDLGLHTYDLGPGSDHWKKMFTTTTIEVGAGLATAASLGGRLAGVSEGVWTMPPLSHAPIAGRLRNRLDQIAAMELTIGGRMRGLVDAVSGFERRTAGRRPSTSTATS